MDDRERREIEDIEVMIMEAEAKRDRESEELRETWENLKQAILEALRIHSLVTWLADKINKIIGE